MVFHVVDRRMNQQNLRRDLAHHGRQPGQRRAVVKNLQVVDQARMKLRPERSAAPLGLLPANLGPCAAALYSVEPQQPLAMFM